MTQVSPGSPNRDVRMRGFRERTEVEAAVKLLLEQAAPLPSESVGPLDASGRVLATEAFALIDVPGFDRSSMDGFAVRADETFGVSGYNPIRFNMIGHSFAGAPFSGQVESGQTVRIMTGAPMPAGADAVVMVENTRAEGNLIDVFEPVTPGRNVSRRGEDVARSDSLLQPGRLLRPQDAGLLSATGHTRIDVMKRPRVGILITGDEIASPETAIDHLPAHCIIDSNSPMLTGLVHRDGGVIGRIIRSRDDRGAVREALEALSATTDVVLSSGGSSVGSEDHLPTLVDELGSLLVHGVALRPASPAGFGRIGEAWVFLLPGNPVSCLAAYEFFAGPGIRRLGGRDPRWPHPRVRAKLRRKIASAIGRVDYVRVALQSEDGHHVADPIATSGASILSSTTCTDGVVLVPSNSEGFAPGAEVEVLLY